ncbi:hypothetical protein M8J76_017383 [Diaphorina citri]|nr:hypothetical protein M8J75_014610 [Diaphorina citri]KAI5746110.1 hypothetical protein M8J76_017383 [Diaphorina citri]
MCIWMSLQFVISFEEWWVSYDVVGSLLGSNVTLECHTRVNRYSNHWEYNRKVENKRQFQYWAFQQKIILPSMDTDKYYYNYTEYQDDPLEYKTTMRLQIKNLKPEDFGTYRCISQPGVQGQTTQEIQLFEIPAPNSMTTDSSVIINRAGEVNVLLNIN